MEAIQFQSVTYKKLKSTELFNIAFLNIADPSEASKKAAEYVQKNSNLKNYVKYGISKHTVKAGDKLTGFHVIVRN